MTKTHPYVLSIAGFDPSAGAGVLADIKTFEANKVYGLGVVSALTYQNDISFEKVEWILLEKIIEQISVLQKRFDFEYVKIGLIENLEILNQLIKALSTEHRALKFIWDPILKASAGFDFHNKIDRLKLIGICQSIYLITPNFDEIKLLTGELDEKIAAKKLSKFCNVFLKGGHNEKDLGRDFLFTNDGKEFSFRAKQKIEVGKHGSGCILSSAITANLAKGNTFHRSCMNAKEYTSKVLMSNKTLLGYHKI